MTMPTDLTHYVLWRPVDRWEVYEQGVSEDRAAWQVKHLVGHGAEAKLGRGTPPKLNPPWTTRAIAKEWDRLEEVVGASLMPEISKVRPQKGDKLTVTLDALGCGAYGCVLPTNDPTVVMKVTTDSSEATFATEILPGKSATARAGFVTYVDALPLESEHKKRPMTVLWRQAADDVGKLADPKGIAQRLGMGKKGRAHLTHLIDHSWNAAQVALRILFDADDGAGEVIDLAETLPVALSTYDQHKDLDGPEVQDLLRTGHDDHDVAASLDYFREVNEAMRGTDLERVGLALNALLDEGVFVGDVHAGNLGRAPDADGVPWWVITDPGNVIMLPRGWRR